ncbi:HAD family hydrolase [Silvimonas iriomotensis]|uniref:Haloacid dehalogenase n=1 Tax=Silvimonas iriomotensis TaxID=449662 RepID=A0ABQ2P6J1_9NEIS|nr:HAD-IA family hydrolase [Silvimonas iriomotensis]GGP19240.1 haloacid dehalogenase [Silvimonas iriomotensis]
MTLKHLICDCDGVLLDSESVALAAILDGLSGRMERAQLDAFLRPRLGMTLHHIADDMARVLGLHLTHDETMHLEASVEDRCIVEAQAIDGVRNALRKVALPMAVASNSSQPRVEAGLRNAGLWTLFAGRIYTPGRGLRPKPAPDLYRAACQGLTADPATTLVLEDSVAGVTAARAAGLTVLGFVGARHGEPAAAQRLRDAGATDVFDDMTTLPARLAAWH